MSAKKNNVPLLQTDDGKATMIAYAELVNQRRTGISIVVTVFCAGLILCIALSLFKGIVEFETGPNTAQSQTLFLILVIIATVFSVGMTGLVYFLIPQMLLAIVNALWPLHCQCPHCEKDISSWIGWKCGTCNNLNPRNSSLLGLIFERPSYSLFAKCSSCDRQPDSYLCHHCGELLLLKPGGSTRNPSTMAGWEPEVETPETEEEAHNRRIAKERRRTESYQENTKRQKAEYDFFAVADPASALLDKRIQNLDPGLQADILEAYEEAVRQIDEDSALSYEDRQRKKKIAALRACAVGGRTEENIDDFIRRKFNSKWNGPKVLAAMVRSVKREIDDDAAIKETEKEFQKSQVDGIERIILQELPE